MKNASYWSGRTVRETFDQWVKVDVKTGCHEWQRSVTPQGYGQLNIGGRPQPAHRFAWERANGPITNGLHVLHSCDNRLCVNVSHLSLGTNKDNIMDTHRKGRCRGPGSATFLWPRRTKSERRNVADTFDSHWLRDDMGCWIWQLSLNDDGYGKVSVHGKKMTAHRFAYERVFGKVPAGLVVRHRCDRPSCVNPEHLEVGTQAENIADMVRKGRQRSAVWVRNFNAKLTPQKVIEIRKAAGNETRVAIAKRYGVSAVLISHVLNGRIWRHVA